MDFLIVILTLFGCVALGVPIAYSLALAAIAGALWIGIPLEAVMLKISDGVSKVAMLTIPFFVLAGAIMAEGGMARRLVAFANVLVGFFRIRGGLSVVNVVAMMFTADNPPRTRTNPTSALANATSRLAMPPSDMMAPASTKNGIVSIATLLTPSEILSITASSGTPIQSAPAMAASASE